MNLSTFQFQPTLMTTLVLLVILVPLFFSLGLWQIDRAQQKRELAYMMTSRHDQPRQFLTNRRWTAEEAQFHHFSIRGEFIADEQILIANRKHLGKPGFHVITPLQVEDGEQILLVNRGWVGSRNGQLPVVDTPLGPVEIHGEAVIPLPPAIELGFDPQGAATWPYLTLDNYRRWSGHEALPFILLLGPDSAHGFVRAWEQARPGPGMHLGYATQWFTFSLLSFLIWLKLSLKRRITTPDREAVA